jgi:hypothetical protein
MAQPHAIQDQQAVQELMITELLAELQAIDDKARMVVRFCKVMDLNSQHEM